MVEMSLLARLRLLWVHQDSNLEPIGYEPTALTIELWTPSYFSAAHPRGKTKRVTGFEPVLTPWKGGVLPLHHTRAST